MRSVETAALLALFALSGVAGLVYESVWSRYLALFLGHSANAQTLVLAIFMGGLALGSAVAARWSERLPLLAAYALTEFLIGIAAFVFHGIFVGGTTAFRDTVVIPFGAHLPVGLMKWLLAAAFVLPQATLLGATFPLLAGRLLRRDAGDRGALVASAYFVNSLGAAVGVLVCGFLLVPWIGLPGAMFIAGSVNLVVAIGAGFIARFCPESPRSRCPAVTSQSPSGVSPVLLAVALVTGAASFCYEIAWIRMLSLVLGASTHAFELMLSAFILGLAGGGWWIRSRITRLARPIVFLAGVQFAMGALALVTLPLYGGTFRFMAAAMSALQANASGYVAFNAISHGVALAVMLPATFCAGMTLPLLTELLLRAGDGERSIGRIYAANTLGAIIGVFLAAHWLMPLVGVKGVIIAGASLDLGLVVVLLSIADVRRRVISLAAIAGGMLLVTAATGIHLDPMRMASGVFRYAESTIASGNRIEYYRDGKTSSVSVQRTADESLVLANNGKPDASMNVADGNPATEDETAMILLGAIPLGLRPDAGRVAVIGLGSGLTTQSVLASDRVDRVDTVEIEAFVVQAAQLFRPRVERTFTDPRSVIHVTDARTYFPAHGERFDVIVSQPSNPWVSGVASLFTREFYAGIKPYLAADGIFAQWIQIYELSTDLFFSVLGAITANFADYRIYALSDVDVLVVAGDGNALEGDVARALGFPMMRSELARVGINSPRDLTALEIGGRKLIEPLQRHVAAPVNSDYFPVLDSFAARSRFLGESADGVPAMRFAPIPFAELLHAGAGRRYPSTVSPRPGGGVLARTATAVALRDALVASDDAADERVPATLRHSLQMLTRWFTHCGTFNNEADWFVALFELSGHVIPYLTAAELSPVWARVRGTPCVAADDAAVHDWIALFEALSRRDAEAVAPLAERLLQEVPARETVLIQYLVVTAVAARIGTGDTVTARRLWKERGRSAFGDSPLDLWIALLVSHLA